MSTETHKPVAQLAQEIASRGVKIFPFNPLTKKPYAGFNEWQKRATTDLEQIMQWWVMWPDAMIAAPTGSINGFFVLDVDAGNGKQGLESLRMLEEKYGPLPTTMVVRTPSGGLHFYFNMPDDVDIRNSTSEIAPNIDVRGNGGCIIWPGSVRPQGKYEVVEQWRIQ